MSMRYVKNEEAAPRLRSICLLVIEAGRAHRPPAPTRHDDVGVPARWTCRMRARTRRAARCGARSLDADLHATGQHGFARGAVMTASLYWYLRRVARFGLPRPATGSRIGVQAYDWSGTNMERARRPGLPAGSRSHAHRMKPSRRRSTRRRAGATETGPVLKGSTGASRCTTISEVF